MWTVLHFLLAPCFLLAGFSLYQVGRAIYNVFLHPLRTYPGPKLWAASRLFWTRYELQGRLPFHIEALHNKYGPVVRVAPDELSFTDPAVMKDIYGGSDHAQLDRDPYIFPPNDFGPEGNIIMVGHAEHARIRKAMAPGFTQRAVSQQAHIVQQHVTALLDHIRSHNSSPVDASHTLGLAAFDIIGHLAFGEEFRCLEGGEYHPLFSFVLEAFIGGIFMSAINRHGLYAFVKLLIPKSMLQKQRDFFDSISAIVRRRLALPAHDAQADFIAHMQRADKQGRNLSAEEMEANSLALVIGGSETVATALSGTLLYLLRDPARLQRAYDEVRSKFASDASISLDSTSAAQLPYMNACIEEGVRFTSPSPFSLARRTSKPTSIGGYAVPAHTSVGLAQWAAFHSPDNFDEPHQFKPERFLVEDQDKNVVFKARQDFHPWSYGPRNCLGKNLAYVEMRLILARLLWNFDMRLDPRDEAFVWTQQKAYLVWQKEPLRVRFKERGMQLE